MKALQILENASKGKLKRISITLEHFPIMEKYKVNDLVGNYQCTGFDDNGHQIWKNKSREVVLSDRENQVYNLRSKPNKQISEALDISEKSVENYKEKIQAKGFKLTTIKEIKKALKISDADIADYFGYSSAMSYSNATRKKHIENGIVQIYERMLLSLGN